jgi:hypothetical protein
MLTKLLRLLPFSREKYSARTFTRTLSQFKSSGGELSREQIESLANTHSMILHKELIEIFCPSVLSKLIIDYMDEWEILMYAHQHIQSVPFWEQLYEQYDRFFFLTQHRSSPSLWSFFKWVEALFTGYVTNIMEPMWKQLSELTEAKCEARRTDVSLTFRKDYAFSPSGVLLSFRTSGDINACKSLIWLDDVVLVLETFNS